MVALRPDLTPQVARLVATRLHDEPGPLRLYYEGSVVRLDGGRRELFQVGVELIDAPQPGGDLEVLALAAAALRARRARRAARSISATRRGARGARRLGLDDEATRGAARWRSCARTARAVAALATRRAVSRSAQQLLAALPSLYGGPEVLGARAHAGRRCRSARCASTSWSCWCARLGALGSPGARSSIDLGEVRGFDYYTGTRFAAYADGVGGALASGGRYDELVERYGRPARAAGFAVDVDRAAELLQAARRAGAAARRGGVLVAGEPVRGRRGWPPSCARAACARCSISTIRAAGRRRACSGAPAAAARARAGGRVAARCAAPTGSGDELLARTTQALDALLQGRYPNSWPTW